MKHKIIAGVLALILICYCFPKIIDFWETSYFENRYVFCLDVMCTIEETYLVSPLPDFLVLTLMNYSNKTYTYKAICYIQKNTDKYWRILPQTAGFAYPDVLYYLKPYSCNEFYLYIVQYHEYLDSGEYRIILLLQEDDKNKKDEMVICEFNVK